MSEHITLAKQISNSIYISRLVEMESNSSHLCHDKEETSDFQSLLETLIEKVNSYAVINVPAQESQDFLATAKCQFAYLWSIAQLRKYLTFEQLGCFQSQFADATIDCALRAAWYSDDLKSIHKHLPDEEGGVPGLFLLGLGKLGGWDLNFSSDVDLIAYYCDKKLPIPTAIGQGYIVNKVLQKMTAILHNSNKTDFVWRVDWRLRPEASSSLLTMSSDAATEFYYYRALPWHRLAMMKARVIAGDIPVGEMFLSDLHAFIWRQNLDLSAIDELAHIKKRINLEHPGLKHQRTQREPIEKECAGFNVKLGSGGIREIEFIINALQLLWGGKKLQLRETNTIKALEGLQKVSLINEANKSVLEESYYFFRDLENNLQMLNNAQTHSVPTETLLQEQLLQLRSRCLVTDFKSAWDVLCDEVFKHRLRINQLFEDFFQRETAAQLDPVELPEDWDKQLDNRSKSIVENWSNGFTAYGIPGSMAVSLEPLSQQLFSAVFENNMQTDVNQWLASIDNFLSAQSASTQYFRLLASYPALIDSIVPPLLYSPHMAKLLKQSPHIVDNLIAPHNKKDALSRLNYYEEQTEVIFTNTDYGARLEGLRRYVNENLYESYLSFMRGELPVKAFQLSLTRLAECTLQASLEIARQELQLDELPIVVLGMGKLAMSRMSPLSDLDLVFIFADEFDLEIAQKVVSRLQTILGMELKEGIAYELDTRLRPSGRSGPPTVFLKGFREHHLKRAKSWEHIALLPSRIVAGDKELAQNVMKIKQDVFRRKRDRKQWLMDAKKMWQRVEDQRIHTVDETIVSSKLRQGGLMQAEYLAVCFCIDELEKTEFYVGNEIHLDRFTRLLENAEKTHDKDIDLNSAIEFWSTVQIWERLLGLENESYDDMPTHLQELMCKQVGCESLNAFYIKADNMSKKVENAMRSYFSSYEVEEKQLEEWQEMSVTWLFS